MRKKILLILPYSQNTWAVIADEILVQTSLYIANIAKVTEMSCRRAPKTGKICLFFISLIAVSHCIQERNFQSLNTHSRLINSLLMSRKQFKANMHDFQRDFQFSRDKMALMAYDSQIVVVAATLFIVLDVHFHGALEDALLGAIALYVGHLKWAYFTGSESSCLIIHDNFSPDKSKHPTNDVGGIVVRL